MAVILQPIIEPQQITNADATYFTATVPTQVLKATVANPTATAQWISLNWIPSGGGVGAANLVVYQRYIQPSETWDILPIIGHVLAVGDKLSAKCSANTALNLMASGVLVSGT